jgi:hypothetical protein
MFAKFIDLSNTSGQVHGPLMYLTLNKIKPRTQSPLPTATLLENKWTWMLLEVNKHNHSHSSPLAPDISIGFLDYYIHYFISSPLRPCDIKPTALPSKYKKKAWRKARNKKAITLGLLSGCKIRPGKCRPLNQMHKIATSSHSARIEPAARCAVQVSIPMDPCTVGCHWGCGDPWGRRANCHWRRRGE